MAKPKASSKRVAPKGGVAASNTTEVRLNMAEDGEGNSRLSEASGAKAPAQDDKNVQETTVEGARNARRESLSLDSTGQQRKGARAKGLKGSVTSKENNAVDPSNTEKRSQESKDAATGKRTLISTSKSGVNLAFSNEAETVEEDSGLITELAQAHELLKVMKQREESNGNLPTELLRLTKRLASPDILNSQSPRVRWLAAQCFADVLFLHAPEAPFEDGTLKRVFQVLVDSLKGLGQDVSSEACHAATYVLSRMAMCKLGCILIDLPETLPGDGGVKTSELASTMFDTVFESIAPSHSVAVERDAIELLAGYLDESSDDNIPACVLDAVLKRLLPEVRKESHRAYDVARGVISRCSERIRTPVTTLVNGLLTGDFDRLDIMQDAEQSSIKDSIHAIILELFRVDPNLLLHVFPNVENLLEIDELESRSKGVKLLCDMFLEVRNDSTVLEYEHLLASLLKRALDKHSSIRVLVTQFAGKCLTSEGVSRQLQSILLSKNLANADGSSTLMEVLLHDSERSIRAEAVEIAALILASAQVASVDSSVAESKQTDADRTSGGAPVQRIAKALVERIHDVSIEISLRSMEGLAWAYARYSTRFDWIPAVVLGDDSKREDPNDYHRIDETRIALIDQALLSVDSKEEMNVSQRVEKLFLLFKTLSTPRSRANFFRCVFKLRKQVREQVSRSLEQRRSKRKVVEVPELGCIPSEMDCWPLIWNMPDNRIFERWSDLLNPLSSRKTMNEARRDLVERTGAALKSQHVDVEKVAKCKSLVRSVCRWTGLWTLSSEELTSEAFESNLKDEASNELMERFVATFPGAFQREDFLERIILAKDWNLKMISVLIPHSSLPQYPRLVSAAKTRLLGLAAPSRESMKDQRKGQTAIADDSKSRKIATKTLLTLLRPVGEDLANSDQEEAIEVLLKRKGKWSASDLCVAVSIARMVPEHEIDMELVEYCVEIAKRPYPAKSNDDEVNCKVASLKLIIEFVLQTLRLNSPPDSRISFCRNMLLMLRSFVSDGGDPWSAQARRMKDRTMVTPTWPPSEEPRFARLRVVCASGLMKVESNYGRSPIVVEGESDLAQLKRQARRFAERARLAFDPLASSREAFLKKVMKIELELGVNMHRNGAFLAIAASLSDGQGGYNRASADLKQLVKFLAQKSQSFQLTDEAKATLAAPELILPNLIYVLAHHPLFPKDEVDYGSFLTNNQLLFTSPIVQFLDALVAAHSKSQQRMDASVSFMLCTLSSIRAKRDVLDEHHGIHCIGDLARLVIQEHLKYSPSALEPYKGKIPLPKVFYDSQDAASHALHTPGGASKSSVAPSPVSYLPVGFALAMPSARKRVRAPKMTRSKIQRNSTSKRTKVQPGISLTPSRTQPKRSARISRSYEEQDSSSEFDSGYSSSETDSADMD